MGCWFPKPFPPLVVGVTSTNEYAHPRVSHAVSQSTNAPTHPNLPQGGNGGSKPATHINVVNQHDIQCLGGGD